MWDCDWLCYSRLFGDCHLFTNSRPPSSPVTPTEATALTAAAAASTVLATTQVFTGPRSDKSRQEQSNSPLSRKKLNPAATLSAFGSALRESLKGRRKTIPTVQVLGNQRRQSSSENLDKEKEAESNTKLEDDKTTHQLDKSDTRESTPNHTNSSPKRAALRKTATIPPTVKTSLDFPSSSSSESIDGTNLKPMDSEEWRKRGKEMVDYIAEYMETISRRKVTPNVEPGYLRSFLPSKAPNKSDHWENIMKDFENIIMPGITHWQHPRFHAYFPAGNSYPSILADMLSDAIGCIGFSWVCSVSFIQK